MCGAINPSSFINTPHMTPLQAYVESSLASACNLLPGTFAVIVDTGCFVSSSYDKKDFEFIYELAQPVRLQGVTGDCQVTHGGVMKF